MTTSGCGSAAATSLWSAARLRSTTTTSAAGANNTSTSSLFDPITLFITLSWSNSSHAPDVDIEYATQYNANRQLLLSEESMDEFELEACREILTDGQCRLNAGNSHGALDCFLRVLSYDVDESTDQQLLTELYQGVADACYALRNFPAAVEYYRKALRLYSVKGDLQGEMVTSGKLCQALKSVGEWDEAVQTADRHISLARQMPNDTKTVLQATYNKASILYAKAKAQLTPDATADDLPEVPESVREDLSAAISLFKECHKVTQKQSDVGSQGRVCGNLGNIYYLLKEYPTSIMFHQERILLAKRCGDSKAEQRACVNLGNCHILLGQYAVAEQFFLRAVELSSANSTALEQQQLWNNLIRTKSLLKTKTQSSQTQQACHFVPAESQSLGKADEFVPTPEQQATFHPSPDSISVLPSLPTRPADNDPENKNSEKQVLNGSPPSVVNPTGSVCRVLKDEKDGTTSAPTVRRISLQNDDLNRLYSLKLRNSCNLFLTPDLSRQVRHRSPSVPSVPFLAHYQPRYHCPSDNYNPNYSDTDDEDLINQLEKCQAQRLNDQRCSLHRRPKPTGEQSNAHIASYSQDALSLKVESNQSKFLDLLSRVQSQRLNDQRAALPAARLASHLYGKTRHSCLVDFSLSLQTLDQPKVPLNNLGNQHAFGLVGDFPQAHIRDPEEPNEMAAHNRALGSNGAPRNEDTEPRAPLPDSFFDMLMKAQGTRMEDQRASVNLPPTSSSSSSRSQQERVNSPSQSIPSRRSDRQELSSQSAPK